MISPSPNMYPHCTASNVNWLGSVPEHWTIGHLRYLVECLDGRRVPLSSDQRGEMQGEFPYWGANRVIDHVNDWLFDEPLVLLGEDGAPFFEPTRDVAFFTSGKIWVNNHAHVLRCGRRLTSQFLAYALNYVDYTNHITGSTRDKLTQQSMGSIPIQTPPLPEQTAIVRYLDEADSRIQRYISAKERLIELLTEQKQAVINQAVTRGLDPNVPLKPSGVDWLGDVPAHWELRRLRALADISTGNRDTVDRQDDGEYPLFVRSQTVERIDSWAFDGEAVLTAGDGVGVGRVFHYANGKFDYHQRVYKFSNFRFVLGRFFFHYFKSTLRFEVLRGTAKSTVDSLRLAMLQNFPFTLPPINEQVAIIEYLDKVTADIDVTIDRARRQVGLMQEYRTRLIADVVTGKLDVRDTAAEEIEIPTS